MTDMMIPEEPALDAAPEETEQPEGWSTQDYWAAAPRAKLGKQMQPWIDAYYDDLEGSGRLERIRRSVATYHGADPESGGASSHVRFSGEDGQSVMANINHYRSILNQAHVLVTSSRPAVSAQADDSTYGPTEETILAVQIIDYDMAHRRLEDALSQLPMKAFQQGEAALLQVWDPLAGKAIGVGPDGRKMYEGDVVDVPLGPLDVIRDTSRALTPVHDHEWVIVRRRANRHELIARFPEYEDCVRAMPTVIDETKAGGGRYGSLLRTWGEKSQGVSGDVFYYELYHAASFVLPEGRYALMLTAEDVPIAAPLGYAEIPLHIMPCDYEEESAWGTSPMWDLLSPQALYNACLSVISSNHEGFGKQALQIVNGGEDPVRKLAVDGLEVFDSSAEIKPIERLRISADSFTYLDALQDIIETLSAIGKIARGNSEPGSSGANNALLDAVATRTFSVASREWTKVQERIFNARLNLYKVFATEPRLLRIAGEDDAAAIRHWTRDDLQKVARVTVKIGNPAAASVEGRKALADEWADRGWITTAEQHIQVLTTGRADPLFQRARNEMRLLKLTVQKLREVSRKLPEPPERGTMAPGEPIQDPMTGMLVPGPEVDAFEQWMTTAVPPHGGVPIALTQKHLLAITELSGHLNSPEALEDERFCACVLSAVQGHIDMRVKLVTEMPWLCEAIGEPLLPSELLSQQAAAMAPPPMPMGGPPPDGMPMPANDNGAPMGLDAPPERAQVPGSETGPVGPESLPFMPRDPRSGEPAQVQGAGGVG